MALRRMGADAHHLSGPFRRGARRYTPYPSAYDRTYTMNVSRCEALVSQLGQTQQQRPTRLPRAATRGNTIWPCYRFIYYSPADDPAAAASASPAPTASALPAPVANKSLSNNIAGPFAAAAGLLDADTLQLTRTLANSPD